MRNTVIAAVGVTLLCLGGVKAETITYGTDGGTILDTMKEALIKPAEQKLGVQVSPAPNADRYPVVKAQVTSGKVLWDVVDFASGYCARGQAENLFEKLDYSLIPNAKSVPAAFKDDYSLGLSAYATVLAYSTKKYGAEAPKSWADFWDVKRFPGKRALRNYARPMLEVALLSDGVAPDKLYPLDVDRAYARLKEIKPYVSVWWTSGAQSNQLLNDGEVDMIALWDGRAASAIEAGAPAAFTRNQAVLESTCLAVLRGTEHKAMAMKLLNELLDPKGQAHWATDYVTGPLNVDFASFMKADRLAKLATAPENLKVELPLNAKWWASEAGEKAEQRWLSFMQQN